MRSSLITKFALITFVSIGYVVTFMPNAQAAPGDYGGLYYDNAANANLTIARSEFVEQSNVNLRLYYPSKPTSGVQLRVFNYNLCVGGGNFDSVRLGRNFGVGNRVTKYDIIRVAQDDSGNVTGEQVVHTFYGGYYTSPSSQCGADSLYTHQIQQGWMTEDKGTGLYFVKLKATVAQINSNPTSPLANNFTNKFQVQIPATGGIVAPEGEVSARNSNGSAVMVERPDNLTAVGTGGGRNVNANFRNYSMRFGSSCEVPSGGTASVIRFYDLDNVPNGQSSPNALNAQEFRSIEIKLRNGTTGEMVDLYAGTGTRSADMKTVYPPFGAEYDNDTYAISFRAMPGQKYELMVNNVYVFNTVQLTLPFDGIYWNVTCDGTKVEPKTTTIKPAISLTRDQAGAVPIGAGVVDEGDQIYVQSRFTNETTTPGKITYSRQVWWDVDGNNDYNISPGGSDIWVDSTTRKPIAMPNRSVVPVPHEIPDARTKASFDGGRRRLCMRLFTYSDDAQTVIRPADRELFQCVLVGKTPTFQVWGSDIRVGGSGAPAARFGVASSIKPDSVAGTSFGSWSEYGAFASGPINGFRTGATFKNGVDDPLLSSKLTFANKPSGGSHAPSAGIGPLSRAALKDHSAFKTNLVPTVPQGTINDTRIYRTAGTATINSNIDYAPNVGGVDAVAQVVIIADSIYIGPSVTNIDAWLIADNVIDTCAGNDIMNATKCNEPLKINGPVMAKTLKLKRAYTGKASDTNRKAVPAEIINLRSDAYVWAHNRYSKSGTATMRTSYISELPPRY